MLSRSAPKNTPKIGPKNLSPKDPQKYQAGGTSGGGHSAPYGRWEQSTKPNRVEASNLPY